MKRSTCEKCETLPTLPIDLTAVYVWPPMGHTTGKMKAIAAKYGDVTSIQGGLAVQCESQHQLMTLLASFDDSLTEQEKADSNCLLQQMGEEPSLDDFVRVSTLRRVIGLFGADWLLKVITEERLTSWFQPIVHAHQPNVPYAHECLLRWRDDTNTWTNPGKLFAKAKEAELLFQLDRKAREVSIKTAHQQGINSKIFINFTPTAIYDPRNCLRTTFEIIRQTGLSPDRFIFEIVETERVNDSAHLKAILDEYRSHGFGVALDDLGAGHSTLELLGALKPDYVKLDMQWVRDVHLDSFKAELVQRVISLAHAFGIKVVAEGIEKFEESAWLRSKGIDYMQGYFFAKPAPKPVTEIERRQTA